MLINIFNFINLLLNFVNQIIPHFWLHCIDCNIYFIQADYASFNVIGQAKNHMAYLEGGDSVQAGIESMSSKPPEDIDPGLYI